MVLMSISFQRDECWSVNRALINEVNEILKYECNVNDSACIFQDHGWTFDNVPSTFLFSIKICSTS